MAPGDKFVRVAFSEAESEVDTSINQTVTALFNNNSPKHHGDLFKIVRFPTGNFQKDVQSLNKKTVMILII